MNVVLGSGEVGTVIRKRCITSAKCYDKGEWEGKNIDATALHICIPYSDDFVGIVQQSVDEMHPKYLIIHSTVEPGTTNKIQHDVKAYSPVMGRHEDNFTKNVCLFRKWIACDQNHYDFFAKLLDVPPKWWGDDFSALEYAKVMSTNYMYWNLIYQKLMHKDCEENGYDFDKVYTEWNINYNDGIYFTHKYWGRPVYDYDPKPTPGGHCLPANIHLADNGIATILQKWQAGRLVIV